MSHVYRSETESRVYTLLVFAVVEEWIKRDLLELVPRGLHSLDGRASDS